MIRSLVEVGDGLGIVFDKAILELLNIHPETKIDVTTDGRRLILEPVRAVHPVSKAASTSTPVTRPDRSPRLGPDLTDPTTTVDVIDALVAEFGMTNDQFRRLHHAQNYSNTITAHRKYCLRPGAGRFRRGETNERTAGRFLAALQELRSGATWDGAIARALELNPK